MPVAVRDFVTGWQGENGERWGRPAGAVMAPDGNLIVLDDDNGLLYRIRALRPDPIHGAAPARERDQPGPRRCSNLVLMEKRNDHSPYPK